MIEYGENKYQYFLNYLYRKLIKYRNDEYLSAEISPTNYLEVNIIKFLLWRSIFNKQYIQQTSSFNKK